ncbi:pilin [Patescibacteria group bacterium]|nr:pilin [Patescibacteria group bacterium]
MSQNKEGGDSMKKFITSAVNTVIYGLPAVALAQTNFGLDNLEQDVNLGNRDLVETIAQIINVVLGFLGVVAVIIILMGGFKWMTAAGNEEKVGEAKKLLGAGVVGLVIILAAFAIASFIINNLSNATGSIG